MRAIADTGFVVAFLNRLDKHHDWAAEIGLRATEPFLTCEAVLAESAFLAQSANKVVALVQRGFLRIAFDLRKNIEEVAALAGRYDGRQPDLADLCLIRMSEIHAELPILTVDETDFRVYRRNGKEVIPIVCPPRN
jgi:predicted nucleic acid-binding protein